MSSNVVFGAVEWEKTKKPFKKFDDTKDLPRFKFFKAKKGVNEVRIITAPYAYPVTKMAPLSGKGLPVRVKMGPADDCPLREAGFYENQRYFTGIINRATGNVEIMELAGMFLDQIAEIKTEWGSPTEWDLKITCNPDGGPSGYYTYINKPPKPLSEEDVIMVEETLEDLEKVLTILSLPAKREKILAMVEAKGLDMTPIKKEKKEKEETNSDVPTSEKEVKAEEENSDVDADYNFSEDDDS